MPLSRSDLQALGVDPEHHSVPDVQRACSELRTQLTGLRATASTMSELRLQQTEDPRSRYSVQSTILRHRLAAVNQSIQKIQDLTGTLPLPLLLEDDVSFPDVVDFVMASPIPMTLTSLHNDLSDSITIADTIPHECFNIATMSRDQVEEMQRVAAAARRLLAFGKDATKQLYEQDLLQNEVDVETFNVECDERLSALFEVHVACRENLLNAGEGTATQNTRVSPEMAELWASLQDVLTQLNACNLALPIIAHAAQTMDYVAEDAGSKAEELFEASGSLEGKLADHRRNIQDAAARLVSNAPWLGDRDITQPESSLALHHVVGFPDPLAISSARQELCKSQYSDRSTLNSILHARQTEESMKIFSQILSRAHARLAIEPLARDVKAWTYNPQNADALFQMTGLTPDDILTLDAGWIDMNETLASNLIEQCVETLSVEPFEAVTVLTGQSPVISA